jgi:hypothetical protein
MLAMLRVSLISITNWFATFVVIVSSSKVIAFTKPVSSKMDS